MRYAIVAAGILAVASMGILASYYASYSRLIDARLYGDHERTLPRVYARPLVLRQGQAVSQPDLVARLNDLGYAQRAAAEAPGEFAIAHDAVAIMPRAADSDGLAIRVLDQGPGADPDTLERLFTPFYTSKPDGLGLGLPMSRSVIESLGGELNARPREQGLEMYCRLPLARREENR